jgi:hypothetical protein
VRKIIKYSSPEESDLGMRYGPRTFQIGNTSTVRFGTEDSHGFSLTKLIKILHDSCAKLFLICYCYSVCLSHVVQKDGTWFTA